MNIKAFIEFVYKDKKRKTGASASSHPIAVRQILLNEGITDEETLHAALLHDVLEDTYISKRYLEHHFGKNVSDIVESLSKRSEWNTSYCRMKGALDDMEMIVLEKPEATLIKMADRLHNLITINGFTIKKQRQYLNETEDVLIPIFKDILENNSLGLLTSPMKNLFKQLERQCKVIHKRLINI